MKKLFFTILLSITLASTAMAQSGFYFGPTTGLNFSTLTKQSYSSARVRWNIGMQVGYQASNIFAAHTEVLYSWQGSKFTNTDTKYSFNYIKVPLMAKMFIIAGLNVEAGVSFNFLINSAAINEELLNGTKSVDINTTDLSKKFDFSIPVGVNYLFFKKLELGLRYDISTIRVWEESDNKSRNSNFSVNVRYRF